MKFFFPLGLIIFLLLGAASMAMGQVQGPRLAFQVENEAGRAVAEQCAEVWAKEGPRILADLAPKNATFDTITCLVLNTPAFDRHFAARLPDWGVGVAMPGGRVIALNYSRMPAIGRGAREVFLHEMVHALLFQVAQQTWLPTWFHEGTAMLYSGEWRFSDTVSLLLDGRVPNLDQLQGRFPAPAGLADRAYRTSLLAVQRLDEHYGPRAVGNILEASARTGAFSMGFQEVTGTSLGDFMTEFASAMNLRLGWAVMLTRWPTLFVLMSLVFAAGAARKMIRSRRRLAEMEDPLESLDP